MLPFYRSSNPIQEVRNTSINPTLGATVALHLTVVNLTCNENGDPDILLLARFHAQP